MSIFALLFLCGAANGSKVTPVQKVVQLMEGMLEKGKKEKHDEQVQFAAYKQFCDDTTVEKKRAIEEANEKIEVLKADIQSYTASAAKLTKEIAELDEDISIWQGDIKAATNVREIEKNDYDTLHKDYSESVDALQRAIAVLKKQTGDRKQAAFVQVAALKSLSLIPEDAKKTIDLFLNQEPEGLAVSAPEANAYEFQSSGVVEMLEKLLDKFIDERTTLEKEEMNSKHAYDMLMQDLNAQIAQGTQDRDEKAESKAQKLQAKADAEGDLKDTTTTRNADAKYLADLTATCEEKASAFESRQQLRADEIVAIEKAIEIISSGAVAGNAEKHLPTLVQTSSFSQLRADLATQAQGRVARFLQARATQLNSRILATLAARATDDPFQKVKKMIKDLIVRLMEEANEEAEHKGWCDTELSTNEQTRKEKTSAVETLHAEIDELEASIAKLTEDISELTKAVAELDAAMAKATKLRTEEKATNTETISDSEAAQTAVAQALTVLKEFYAKAAEATAFVQKKAEPEIFDSEYKGMQSENGGVVGMLEVIESDFARLESDTKAAEATAQKEYDEFMTDSKVDKSEKSTDIEHKTAKKQDESQA
jgi:prefoldin subunit 5